MVVDRLIYQHLQHCDNPHAHVYSSTDVEFYGNYCRGKEKSFHVKSTPRENHTWRSRVLIKKRKKGPTAWTRNSFSPNFEFDRQREWTINFVVRLASPLAWDFFTLQSLKRIEKRKHLFLLPYRSERTSATFLYSTDSNNCTLSNTRTARKKRLHAGDETLLDNTDVLKKIRTLYFFWGRCILRWYIFLRKNKTFVKIAVR